MCVNLVGSLVKGVGCGHLARGEADKVVGIFNENCVFFRLG